MSDPEEPPSDIRAALIAAESAHTSSRVAAGAAIFAALAAIGGAGITAWISTKAESENSRQEFLRNQRQVLYSRVVNDTLEMRDQADAALAVLADAPPKALARRIIDEPGAQSFPGFRKLIADESSIAIVGSESARDGFADVLKAYETFIDNVDESLEAYVRDDSRAPNLEGAITAAEEARDAEDAFKDAARIDLANEAE